MTDVELTRALERGEVPNEGFHHADHLRVAWVYLQESATVDAAFACMAATLRRFAASVGKAEKYSDAITAFWMYQMAAVRAMMPAGDCASALRAYPRLLDKDLINAAPPRAPDSPRDAPHRPLPGRSG
jgi:hypothetical protein